jgi:hypothetical protein
MRMTEDHVSIFLGVTVCRPRTKPLQLYKQMNSLFRGNPPIEPTRVDSSKVIKHGWESLFPTIFIYFPIKTYMF